MLGNQCMQSMLMYTQALLAPSAFISKFPGVSFARLIQMHVRKLVRTVKLRSLPSRYVPYPSYVQ